MRRVDRPNFSARKTFATCIDRIRDTGLKTRLKNVENFIVSEADTYSNRAASASLHLIGQTNGVLEGLVTTDEMVALYDQKMAGPEGPPRHIYNAIKGLPKHGICPFCDHRTVSTLDHILPKRLFPTFAVAPDNLVGACADCNRAKRSSAPTMPGDTVLHPYFDDIDSERWLDALVVEGPVAALIFRTKVVPSWSTDLNERVRQLFK